MGRPRSFRKCNVEDCDKPHFGRGFCSAHYERFRRHGDPLGGRAAWGEPERYFNEVVVPYDGDDCLEWPYARAAGYGVFSPGGVAQGVHRRLCREVHGEPPTPEHEAAHSCGNGHLGCCTKRHLSWKTPRENCADRIVHGTQPRGETHKSAKISASEASRIRNMKGERTVRAIAQEFSLSPSTVWQIQNGKTWRDHARTGEV